jgi:Na+/melibiose symporter-like transporter
VLIPDFLAGVSQGVLGGLFLFFVQHKLQFGELASPLLLLYFVGAFAGVGFWVWLSKRTSKHQALQYASLYTAATVLIIPMLPPGNLWVVAPMILIGGLGNGAPVLLLRSMMVDVIDEDHVKTGTQRAGLFFGLLLTTTKVGQALGPVCYGVLAVFGFNATQGAANTETAMMALTVLFAGLPFLLNGLIALSLRDYPLDEARQKALRETLETAAPTPPAPDPASARE